MIMKINFEFVILPLKKFIEKKNCLRKILSECIPTTSQNWQLGQFDSHLFLTDGEADDGNAPACPGAPGRQQAL